MLNEKSSTALDCNYVSIENKGFLVDSGVLISTEESTLKSSKIQELINHRIEANDVYDYAYGKTTGFLRRRPTIKKEREAPVIVKQKIRITEKSIISYLALVVAFMALVLSFMFSYLHQIKYFETLASVVFASVIVIFNTIALPLSIMFFKKRGKHILLGCLVIVLWIPCMLYSITNMLDIMYDRTVSKVEEKYKELSSINSKATEIELKENEIKRAEKSIEDLKLLSAEALTSHEYYASLGNFVTRAHNALEQKKKYDAEIVERNASIERLHNELMSLTLSLLSSEGSTDNKQVKSVYHVLAPLFKTDALTLEVFITMLPAMFFDLIAPIMAALVTILLSKEDKKNVGSW